MLDIQGHLPLLDDEDYEEIKAKEKGKEDNQIGTRAKKTTSQSTTQKAASWINGKLDQIYWLYRAVTTELERRRGKTLPPYGTIPPNGFRPHELRLGTRTRLKARTIKKERNPQWLGCAQSHTRME